MTRDLCFPNDNDVHGAPFHMLTCHPLSVVKCLDLLPNF